MIVTAHQLRPNYLPGLNVVEKVAAADAVIWLDECQYTHGGWTNRNRMPDGSWLTVPVERGAGALQLNRVRISEHDGWRARHCRTLTQQYGEWATHQLCQEIERPYRLLIGLNLACLRILLADVFTPWHFQSHLDGGRALTAVSDDRAELAPISERLAIMVAELGGDTYLSGPSGFRYLDEQPFAKRGIEVAYWVYAGASDCSVARLVSDVRR